MPLKLSPLVTSALLATAAQAFQFPASSLLSSSFRQSASSQILSHSSIQRNRKSMKGVSTTSATRLAMSTQASSLGWGDLQVSSGEQAVGSALNKEAELRKTGKGSAHVQSKLRLFASDETPKITLYRDHAGWCPYCQKTMLLIEEKNVPINIELVPMRSYGDKPSSFMRLVRGGILPAITVERKDGQLQTITESQVIMELLDSWHPESEGYKPMMPDNNDAKGLARYDQLARLERELFSWWCTLIFRPEGPKASVSGIMGMLSGKKSPEMSGAMTGFLDCMSKVDKELKATSGPWFFDKDYPTMIDFVFVSHVERMLASCAYWKGLDLRSEDMKGKYPGLNRWLDAFEKRECYLAFKSDYYTHIKDIPPQYGPGWDGGFEDERDVYSKMITGSDGTSWTLPLSFDDPIQPLYKGPPLPLCVLEAAGIQPDADGTYEKSDPDVMARVCRQMAGWKLAGNGDNVSRFAARGGSKGAKNPRQSFGAELADPYAEPDTSAIPYVDAALRVVVEGLLGDEEKEADHMARLQSLEAKLSSVVPADKINDVKSSIAYLRDRIGVPRDLPLASGRQLRAHLNWAVDTL